MTPENIKHIGDYGSSLYSFEIVMPTHGRLLVTANVINDLGSYYDPPHIEAEITKVVKVSTLQEIETLTDKEYDLLEEVSLKALDLYQYPTDI